MSQSLSPSKPDALWGQMLRYGVTGAGLAALFAFVYELVLRDVAAVPQLANALAFLTSTAAGYFVHSRWSFRGHGSERQRLSSAVKFFVVNAVSFTANIFWVWLLVDAFHLSPHAPLVPIMGLTPALSFWLNRNWTFSAA